MEIFLSILFILVMLASGFAMGYLICLMHTFKDNRESLRELLDIANEANDTSGVMIDSYFDLRFLIIDLAHKIPNDIFLDQIVPLLQANTEFYNARKSAKDSSENSTPDSEAQEDQ